MKTIIWEVSKSMQWKKSIVFQNDFIGIFDFKYTVAYFYTLLKVILEL